MLRYLALGLAEPDSSSSSSLLCAEPPLFEKTELLVNFRFKIFECLAPGVFLCLNKVSAGLFVCLFVFFGKKKKKRCQLKGVNFELCFPKSKDLVQRLFAGKNTKQSQTKQNKPNQTETKMDR